MGLFFDPFPKWPKMVGTIPKWKDRTLEKLNVINIIY
jgi:hypothetical protein